MSQRIGFALCLCILLLMSAANAWDVGRVRVRSRHLDDVGSALVGSGVSCMQSYYYLLRDCPYVTVLDEVGQDEAFGVHFNMLDSGYWHPPCDTSSCLSLDVIELVFYDVLAPPADQSLNVKVFGADSSGQPIGDLLGNRDFAPSYVESAGFTSVEIDFTNGAVEPGLDLSGCEGCFVVLLTWKNSTGRPAFVLDNIGTCVDSCAVDAACCEMGIYPYVYPRKVHTYYYGTEWAWSKQDSVCDPCGCATYGCLEALWTCGFCTKSTATEPTTWSGIKAMYK